MPEFCLFSKKSQESLLSQPYRLPVCAGTYSPFYVIKAEEELVKAQKVFEEMNIDLQEELPSLWNR